MDNKLLYYNKGDALLSDEEPIYLNKSREQAQTHLHAHEFIEIAYVVSGCGTHSIGDNIYKVSKGDLFIINYNIPHQFRSYEDSTMPKLYVYNCIFKPEFLDYRLVNCQDFSHITELFLFRSVFPEEAAYDKDIRLQGKDSHAIEELYEKMYREYKLKEEGYIEILRAYVIELLITVFRTYKRNISGKDSIETHRQKIINKVILYMKQNYKNEIKLEDLSTLSFLSPSHFSRLFKECTSMTVSEYMQRLRIEEAQNLLRTTERTVLDISCQVGYRDIKYFYQVFKRISGTTPNVFRKYRDI